MTVPSVNAMDAGTVPRLHQRRVELVERALVGRHRLVVLPRLGDHHQHRVRQRAPAEVEQLERLVEPARVRRAGRADRVRPVEAGQMLAGQQRFAGAHPVLVAHHRVDLAVVGDHPVRMRERPRRERVGREPRVHERERGLEPVVDEVGIEVGELAGDEHALVDERASRQRREVGADLVLDALARRRTSGDRARCPRSGSPVAGQEQLLERRLGVTRHLSDHRVVVRHVPPAEDGQVLAGGDLLDGRPSRPRTLRDRVGRNAQPTAYVPASGSSKSTTSRRKPSGIWTRMPAPSPTLASAPVAPRWSRWHSDAMPRSMMRWLAPAVHVDDEADTAGVVLECRVVQALRAGNVVHRRHPVRVGSVWSRHSGRHWPVQLHHVTGVPGHRRTTNTLGGMRGGLGRAAMAFAWVGAALAAGCSSASSDPAAPPPTVVTSATSASVTTTSSTTTSTVPTTSTTPPPQPVTIAFAGDINFEGAMETRLAHGPASAIGPFTPILSAADLARSAISSRRSPPAEPRRTRISPSGRRRLRSTRCGPAVSTP